MLWLQRLRSHPDHVRVDPVGVERNDLGVEVSRRTRCFGDAVEVADVLPGLLDDLRAVVRIELG
jgi:hypothetical protein